VGLRGAHGLPYKADFRSGCSHSGACLSYSLDRVAGPSKEGGAMPKLEVLIIGAGTGGLSLAHGPTVSLDLLVRSLLALGASNRDLGRIIGRG
jgi:hypothetical protein